MKKDLRWLALRLCERQRSTKPNWPEITIAQAGTAIRNLAIEILKLCVENQDEGMQLFETIFTRYWKEVVKEIGEEKAKRFAREIYLPFKAFKAQQRKRRGK